MRVISLVALLVVWAFMGSAAQFVPTVLAEEEDHPFGPRPDKDAPLDDPFVKPFNDDNDAGKPVVAPVAKDPVAISDDPFGDLPDEAFKTRPAVKLPVLDKPIVNEPEQPDIKPEEPYTLQLDINGDNNITDIEVAAAIEGVLKDAKARTLRGEKIREAFDANKDGKVEPMEVAEVVVAERIAKDVAAARVAEIFNNLDTNGDKQVDPTEFLEIADKLGIPQQFAVGVLKDRFTKLDRDANSKISHAEAILSAEAVSGPWGRGGASEADEAAMARAQEVLKELDRDGNNELSEREAARNAQLRGLFAQLDVDKSASVTLGEMYDFLRAQANQAAEEARRQERREGWERFGKGFPGKGGFPGGSRRDRD